MKQLGFLLLALLPPARPASAQAPARQLSLEDAVLNAVLQPQDLPQLSWLPGTAHDFAYLRPATAYQPAALVRGSATSRRLTTLVTLPVLAQALHAAGAARPDTFPKVQWQNARNLLVTAKGDTVIFTYDVLTGRARRLFGLKGAYDLALDVPHAQLAYSSYTEPKRYRVPRVDAAGWDEGTIADTTRLVPRRVGRGEVRLRNAYDLRWSPSGKLLLFRTGREESTGVRPRSSYNLTTGRLVLLPEQLRRATSRAVSETFSPDEASLYLAVPDRDDAPLTNELALQQYRVATGQLVRTLFTEPAPTLVGLEAPRFVPGPTGEFVWQSTHDGFPHLYLYARSGQLLRQLTRGNFLVTSVLGFSADGQEIIYASTAAGPLESQLYAQPLHGGPPRLLTPEPGTHLGALSPDGRYLLTRFSSPTVPLTIQVISVATGRPVRRLLRSPNPLAAYACGNTTIVPIRAADGKATLYGRLLTPPGYDPTRRYPVVVQVGSGPPSLHLADSWQHGADLRLQYLAQRGYVVLSVERLTYVDRGATFADPATSQFWYRFRWHRPPNVYGSDNGETAYLERADMAQVLRYAKALPGIDSSRVALLEQVSPYESDYLAGDYQSHRKVSIVVFPNGSGGSGPPGTQHLIVTYRPEEDGRHEAATAFTGPVDYQYCPATGRSREAAELGVFRVIVRYLAAHL